MNEAHSPGLSQRLADFITRTPFGAVPASALAAAARVVLDATGVIRAASALAPEVRPFLALAREGGAGVATVLGTDIATRAPLAALANGAMAHALDYEDAFDGAPLHPNASLVPAALALAQAHRPVAGRAFLATIAIGCEVSCRIALSLRQRLEVGGWYPPPILGAYGAVAGAARIAGFTPRQLLDAWSLLLLQNSCAGQIKHDRNSVIRAVREAFPAQIAVQAAQLARRGVRGFDAPLEGRDGFFRLFASNQYDPDVLFEDLGQRWHVEQLSFKPWPSCRGTHAAIECALQLRAAVDWREIREIRIEGCEVHRMLAEPIESARAPQTAIDAKFSLPFTVATAFVAGRVDLDSFAGPARDQADVLDLARRVSFGLRDGWSHDHAVSGAVHITLLDGRALQREILDPSGSPARPLTDAQLITKFVDCAARAQVPLASAQANALAGRILQLADEADAGAAIAT